VWAAESKTKQIEEKIAKITKKKKRKTPYKQQKIQTTKNMYVLGQHIYLTYTLSDIQSFTII
jgi:hypothetical protein